MSFFPLARQARSAAVTLAGLSALAVAALGWRILLGSPPMPSASARARERTQTPSGMVYVPGGAFTMGTNDADADDDVKPEKQVWVPSFYIDRTEVTNHEFHRFRKDFTYPTGEDELPATNVTYAEADAYARWAGKRLPLEAEWEKAARGTDGRRYPWGNQWNPKKVAARAKTSGKPERVAVRKTPGMCRTGPSRVRPVGSVPDALSPYGCVDMAGNAWEWVQGFYNGNPDQRILRGGAVGYGERSCRTYPRAIEGAGAT